MTSDSASKQAKEALILDLFDNYLSAKPSADNLRQYLAAVETFSVEAVARSVEQFRAGLVERDNPDFAPSGETFSRNVRKWQEAMDKRNQNDGFTLHNGLLSMDWGQGTVNMRGLTNAEQDAVIAAKGVGPDGRSLSYMPVEQIRAAIGQKDLAQVDGGKTFKAPRLGSMP